MSPGKSHRSNRPIATQPIQAWHLLKPTVQTDPLQLNSCKYGNCHCPQGSTKTHCSSANISMAPVAGLQYIGSTETHCSSVHNKHGNGCTPPGLCRPKASMAPVAAHRVHTDPLQLFEIGSTPPPAKRQPSPSKCRANQIASSILKNTDCDTRSNVQPIRAQ